MRTCFSSSSPRFLVSATGSSVARTQFRTVAGSIFWDEAERLREGDCAQGRGGRASNKKAETPGP